MPYEGPKRRGAQDDLAGEKNQHDAPRGTVEGEANLLVIGKVDQRRQLREDGEEDETGQTGDALRGIAGPAQSKPRKFDDQPYHKNGKEYRPLQFVFETEPSTLFDDQPTDDDSVRDAVEDVEMNRDRQGEAGFDFSHR
mmetsp:Transcript_31213/g.63894  ORF Transcript_31213/g.63894 Transcript_31213/m.63894 type:complete len:139 (+) Transcript_31213:276-692(+)